MADREKVIKETKDGIAFAESRGFGGLANTMRDALAMLKEQQAEIEQLRNDAKARRCKDCKHRYDGCCYSRVSNRINFLVEVPDDWFCADFDPSDEVVLEAFAEDG